MVSLLKIVYTESSLFQLEFLRGRCYHQMRALEAGLRGEDLTSLGPRSLQDGATCWLLRLRSPHP